MYWEIRIKIRLFVYTIWENKNLGEAVMDSILQVLTAITVLLLTAVLIIKGIQRKDFSVLGEIMACTYLVGAIVVDLVTNYNASLHIHFGIFVVLFSFLATHAVYLVTGRFKQMTLSLEILQVLKNLQDKYNFILANTFMGIYVINLKGRFEFVSRRMMEITEYSEDELLKMTVFDLLSKENKELIRSKLLDRASKEVEQDSYPIDLITKSGKVVKVMVHARVTSNGHPTITGSITLLEG